MVKAVLDGPGELTPEFVYKKYKPRNIFKTHIVMLQTLIYRHHQNRFKTWFLLDTEGEYELKALFRSA